MFASPEALQAALEAEGVTGVGVTAITSSPAVTQRDLTSVVSVAFEATGDLEAQRAAIIAAIAKAAGVDPSAVALSIDGGVVTAHITVPAEEADAIAASLAAGMFVSPGALQAALEAEGVTGVGVTAITSSPAVTQRNVRESSTEEVALGGTSLGSNQEVNTEQNNTAAIAGGVVGGAFVLLLALLLAAYYYKKQRQAGISGEEKLVAGPDVEAPVVSTSYEGDGGEGKTKADEEELFPLSDRYPTKESAEEAAAAKEKAAQEAAAVKAAEEAAEAADAAAAKAAAKEVAAAKEQKDLKKVVAEMVDTAIAKVTIAMDTTVAKDKVSGLFEPGSKAGSLFEPDSKAGGLFEPDSKASEVTQEADGAPASPSSVPSQPESSVPTQQEWLSPRVEAAKAVDDADDGEDADGDVPDEPIATSPKTPKSAGTPGRRSFFEVIVDNVKEGTEEIGHQAEELGRTVSGFFAGANPLSPSPRTSDSPGRTPKREDV